MALTTSDSNLNVDVLQAAIPGAFAGMTMLLNSGAVIIDGNLPTLTPNGGKPGTGSKILVPYMGNIGDFTTIAAEGDGVTPVALTSTEEEDTYVHDAIAVEMTRFARMTAQAIDPYSEAARQIVVSAKRKMEKRLITKALTTTLSRTVATSIVEDDVTLTRYLFGDEDNDIAMLIAHSRVVASMRLLKDSTGRRLYQDSLVNVNGVNQSFGMFNGIPVLQSDLLTPTGTDYPTLICKRGSLVAWFDQNVPILEDVDILANTHVMAAHLYHVCHLYKRMPGGTKCGVAKLVTREAAL